MADRSTSSSPGHAPAPRPPRSVRNVVLLGPAGAGKTTLLTALLARAGQGLTAATPTSLTVCSLEYHDIKVNLFDPPGATDLVGAALAGLRAADAALFVLSAAGGLDGHTVQLWRMCEEIGLPRAVVITQLDRPRADFDESVAVCQRLLGEGVHPLYLPLHGEAEDIAGLMALLSQRVHDWSSGDRVERDPDPQHLPLIENLRAELVEAILANSDDDRLLESYLDGTALDYDAVIADLETAVARGLLHPVVPVAPLTGVGTDEVLDLIVAALPSPLEHPLPVVSRPDGAPAPPLSCDPTGPLAAEVVHIRTDAHAGRICVLRVLSGTLRPDSAVLLSGHGHTSSDAVAALFAPMGPALRPVAECPAGDVCVVRLQDARVMDTLSAATDPLLLERWQLPAPQHPVALVGASPSDAGRLAAAMTGLAAADPTVRVEHTVSGQQLLWSLGEVHTRVLLDRLDADHGVRATVEAVRIDLLASPDGPLEPVSTITVRIPSSYARSVRSDLTGRRAVVTGMEELDDEVAEVTATVPDRELLAYAVGLSALTHGTGSFSREPAGHQPAGGPTSDHA